MTVTVLSGPERRRRWTAAEKLRVVEETLEPEASVTGIALRHDIHPNLLHAWRRQARTGVLADAVESKSKSGREAGFAAVAIAQERPSLFAAAPSGAGMIEMELANGSRLRVTGAVDPATLAAALAVLASKGGRK
jgi:transposase